MTDRTAFKNRTEQQMIDYAVRMRLRAEAAEKIIEGMRQVALHQPCVADIDCYCDVRGSMFTLLGIDEYTAPEVHVIGRFKKEEEGTPNKVTTP